MKYILLGVVFLVFSCKRDDNQTHDKLPALPSNSLVLSTFKDIMSIKKIKQGLTNHFGQDSAFIAINFTDRVRLNQILILGNEKKKIFNALDSIYFTKQLKNIQNFTLDRYLISIDKMVLVDEKSIAKRISNSENETSEFGYYVFSKPFISADHNKVFIQVEYMCPNCGYGIVLIFEKKNGKWLIKDEASLWDS